MRPTVKDIARHAGVSAATVSLVLRNSPLVAAATRAGVQSSIDSLGYVYHRAAANLRMRLTHTVGLVICEITNPFYAELAAGIDDALDQAGWVAFVANTAESPARQSRFIARMREHRVDGILLAPGRRDLRRGRRRTEAQRHPGRANAAARRAAQRGLCQRRLPARHDPGGRASDPTWAPAHRLRRRRAPGVARARPNRGLPRDPAAIRIAGRADRQLPADARGRRRCGRPALPRQIERADRRDLP